MGGLCGEKGLTGVSGACVLDFSTHFCKTFAPSFVFLFASVLNENKKQYDE